MRILVTNDDGINAPGLKIAVAVAEEIAGPAGEVWVVAPAFEQSGVGHCISYTHPMMVARMGHRTYATEGSPADCVIAGIYDVLDGAKPDLLLSGVNRGNNAGENVLYSGTVGAAMEGALQGVPSIALSQYLGPETADLENPFEAAASHGAAVVRAILQHATWAREDYSIFYNVNFPPIPAAKVAGTRITRQGFRRDAHMAVVPHVSPSGRRFLWITSGAQHNPTLPGTDVAANLADLISITPLRADLTADDAVEAMAPHFA